MKNTNMTTRQNAGSVVVAVTVTMIAARILVVAWPRKTIFVVMFVSEKAAGTQMKMSRLKPHEEDAP